MPLAHLADQPDDHQRIAAQGEKIIVYADPFDAQKLAPDVRQPQLPLSARRNERFFELMREVRRRQSSSVHFAIGG